ncbi:MAG: hypothetical protein ACYDG6_08105 [Thermincolia bacterium]
MNFVPYSRTPSGEVYTMEHEGHELGELAVVYGHNDLQAIAGVRQPESQDERDHVDLAIADFIKNLAEAAEVEYFQVNIYDSDDYTSIDNYDEDEENCNCGCQNREDSGEDL